MSRGEVSGTSLLTTAARTLPCPSCREIVREDAEACRFCYAPLDRETAAAAAALQSRVNQACSDASYIRIAAGAMWTCYACTFLPGTPWLNSMLLVIVALLPLMLVRWQWRFGRLVTEDPDYARARRAKNIAFLMWLVLVPVAFVVVPMLDKTGLPE